MRFFTAVALAASVVGMAAAADLPKIEPVIIKDRHFYLSESNKPFFVRLLSPTQHISRSFIADLTPPQIKGVDYQPGGAGAFAKGHDPLSDVNTCARDIYLMQQLGINTIRVYSVDPALNHDECMTLLAQAGIYLVLDVNSPLPNEHLHQNLPWTTYTPAYLKHIFTTIDVFSGYPNTMMFLAGNEVIFDKESAAASPQYIKAVIRDMKAYITNHVARVIPVGYSNADDLDFRTSLAAYLECGDVGYADFFGVNSYQWCGDNTFLGSGYDTLVEDYTPFSYPIYFTEFGCNAAPPRLWQEIGSIYHHNMTGVFSGGLVYEFTEEPNNYGLVQLDKKGGVETLDDFTRLQEAYRKVQSVSIPADTLIYPRPRKCADSKSKIFSHITANNTLPDTLGAEYIKSGVKTTRGKLLPSVDTRKTEYPITLNGKLIEKPHIVQLFNTEVEELPAGGHGKNVGGGVGKGEPEGSLTEKQTDRKGKKIGEEIEAAPVGTVPAPPEAGSGSGSGSGDGESSAAKVVVSGGLTVLAMALAVVL